MIEINILDVLDNRLDEYRTKLFAEIKTMTVYHWVRLGICFGLLRWFEFAAKMIIASRAVDRVMILYQMGILDKTTNTSMVETVGDVYVAGFLFESIFIIFAFLGSWILLVWKFGLPRRIINL